VEFAAGGGLQSARSPRRSHHSADHRPQAEPGAWAGCRHVLVRRSPRYESGSAPGDRQRGAAHGLRHR
jgi:hypothetical protein